MHRVTWANGLTVLRIVLTPFLAAAIFAHDWWSATLLLGVAGLSDLFDGLVARWLQEETTLGAYLDPVADKFLLGACYVALLFAHTPCLVIPLWFVALVLVRDGAILLGALYVVVTRAAIEIKPTLLGKITTALQLCFVSLIFLCSLLSLKMDSVLQGMLWLVAGFVIASLLHYAYHIFGKVWVCGTKNM